MDEQAVLLARTVARAASAWFNEPLDYETYRRLALAVSEWNTYSSPPLPQLDEPELLDEAADHNQPVPLGGVLPDLENRLRRAHLDSLE